MLYSTYLGDGNGRDSYIIIGNAGQYKAEAARNERPPRTGYQSSRNCTTLYAGELKAFMGPHKETSICRYFGDGSGRDSYVIKDGGVPQYASTSPHRILVNTLRQAPNEKALERDSEGRVIKDWTKPWYKSIVKTTARRQSIYQTILNQRLAKPRSVRRERTTQLDAVHSPQMAQLNQTLQRVAPKAVSLFPQTAKNSTTKAYAPIIKTIVTQYTQDKQRCESQLVRGPRYHTITNAAMMRPQTELGLRDETGSKFRMRRATLETATKLNPLL